MYSTCIFCNASLGTNQVIEHFPVGRRLAFDSATGRLWAVCRKCERWNLSPLEERWEALEECERAFERTAMRASTDNIGLARVSEGLELVRIGRPLRPEMAAWRYGDQFGRRRRRYYTYAGLGAAAVAGVYIVGPALGLYAFGGGAAFFNQFPQLYSQVYRRAFGRVKLPVPGAEKPLVLEPEQVAKVNLVPDDNPLGWALRVPVSKKKLAQVQQMRWDPSDEPPRIDYIGRAMHAVFTGTGALQVAGKILPKVNAAGAGKDDVQRAVTLMAEDADPAHFFATESQREASSAKGRIIKKIPKHVRLALEMSTHEDTERRALEGELAMLEAAWKQADEIAHISDNLLLPAEVDGWLARLKARR